jgi:hypothetical protein
VGVGLKYRYLNKEIVIIVFVNWRFLFIFILKLITDNNTEDIESAGIRIRILDGYRRKS